jgi:hypothetical protein
MTMPSDMVVAPFTLEQTVEVVCVAPVDADDEVELEAPLDMPAMELELVELELDPVPGAEVVGVLEPASLDAAEAVGAGWEVASTTEVAESTSTAATPTVVSAAHHILAARPMLDQRCLTRCVRRSIAPPRYLFATSLNPRCQGRASGV